MPLVEKKLTNIKEAFYPTHYTQTKLSKVFNDLIIPKNRSILAQKYPSLYSYSSEEEQDSLLVLFNNGIDIDPKFSGEVIGRIFLNKETNDLELIIWPIDEKNHPSDFRKEVLLKDISDFSFSFFDPMQDETPPTPEWTDKWEKVDYFPPIVKLNVEYEKKEKETFYFFPPSSSAMITYRLSNK